MSNYYFVKSLESLSEEARRCGKKSLSDTDVKVLASKYLDGKESHLLTEEGQHFLSFGDVLSNSAMNYVFDTVKNKNASFFYGLDTDMMSPYHYAATYDLDGVFSHLCQPRKKQQLDLQQIRSLCLHVHPDTKHSVPSLLISKDRKKVLKTCMCETLQIDPYESEFTDTYVTWLHESVASDAPKTALYLRRSHPEGTSQCLSRSSRAVPTEHMTPLDLVLLGDHRDKVFYVDIVLGGYPGGYKTIVTSYNALLARMDKWRELTTSDPTSFIVQCVRDNVAFKSHAIK